MQKISPLQEKIQIFSPVKQRILQFVEYLNISKRDFYSKTGISRGTLESATGINEETLAKVIANYKNVSPTWLITGNGNMILEDNSSTVTVNLNEVQNSLCKSCKEKERTINALEKTVATLEKINRSLEQQIMQNSRVAENGKPTLQQTGSE